MADKSPEQLIREAASAAEQLLLQAEQERVGMEAKLRDINTRIAQLRAVISAGNMVVNPGYGTVKFYGGGDDARMGMTSTVISTSSGTVTFDDTPQSAYTRISAIIHTNPDKEFSAADLPALYESEFGEKLPQSTLYAALAKGKRKGTFLVTKDGKFRSQRSLKKVKASDA